MFNYGWWVSCITVVQRTRFRGWLAHISSGQYPNRICSHIQGPLCSQTQSIRSAFIFPGHGVLSIRCMYIFLVIGRRFIHVGYLRQGVWGGMSVRGHRCIPGRKPEVDRESSLSRSGPAGRLVPRVRCPRIIVVLGDQDLLSGTLA